MGQRVALLATVQNQRAILPHLRGDGLRVVGALIIGAWLLGRRARRVAAWAAPVVIFVELYSFGADFNGTIEPAAYTETPATAREILADHTTAAPPRIVSWSTSGTRRLIGTGDGPTTWSPIGVITKPCGCIRGAIRIGQRATGVESAASVSPRGVRPGYPAFAALASVEYAVRYSRDGGFEVQRLTTALPRAYVVGQYHLATSPRAGLGYMARGFPMRREVVLEEAPPASIGLGGAAEIVRYEDEEVAVALTDSVGGILVLSDTYYPGWRAFVDGVERPILRANHVFRAVEVPGWGARGRLFVRAE